MNPTCCRIHQNGLCPVGINWHSHISCEQGRDSAWEKGTNNWARTAMRLCIRWAGPSSWAANPLVWCYFSFPEERSGFVSVLLQTNKTHPKKSSWSPQGFFFLKTQRKEGITPWCNQLNWDSESCLIWGFKRFAFFLERSHKSSVWTRVTSLQPARFLSINETQLKYSSSPSTNLSWRVLESSSCL